MNKEFIVEMFDIDGVPFTPAKVFKTFQDAQSHVLNFDAMEERSRAIKPYDCATISYGSPSAGAMQILMPQYDPVHKRYRFHIHS